MTDNGDQLSVTFAAHEHLAPDAADVLARAHRIARSYQRRRWAVRATGGAVLGAGLVASGIALPGRLGHSSGDQTVIATPLAGGGSASPSASPSTTYTQSEELAEYFAAGYDYNDAVQLATLWNDTDIVTVKADAGLKLLEGETLPIPPSESPGAGAETKADVARNAFFAAGYTYDDAVTLGNMWKDTNTYQVKAEAGQKLLDGQTLPIPPSGPPETSGTTVVGSSKVSAKKERLAKLVKSYAATDDSMSPALTAYFAAGYDYPNAVALGQLWNETDITQIKTEAGQKLLDGETLPVKPDNPPPPADSKGDAARAAFFAAGYTYQDAVTLGNMWNDTNTYQVKAEAGQKLLDGQTLPIAP
jgi:hypothetical protein